MGETDWRGLSEADWRARLTPAQYHVLREKGTEPAFGGDLWDQHAPGVYACAGCGQELFRAEDKFDSGTGWPSFSDAIARERLELREDKSLLMSRTEVLCARCGGHLGHVFPDGPPPTRLRFCMNSVALSFKPER